MSSFAYTSSGWLQSLATPYGSTTFDYQWAGDSGASAAWRWVKVTEPNGGNQIYLFNFNCGTLWSGATWISCASDHIVREI